MDFSAFFSGSISILLSTVAFFVIFSVLVLVHELGHFFVAKWSGVKVEEFGMGLPPKAKVLCKKGDTEYTLNWIPFGGFVRMLGEDDVTGQLGANPKSFSGQSVWKRLAIASAGVIMNIILAYVLLMVMFVGGMRQLFVLPDSIMPASIHSYLLPSTSFAEQQGIIRKNPAAPYPVTIDSVEDNSAAKNANISDGSSIITLNGTSFTSVSEYLIFYKKLPKDSDLSFVLQDKSGREYTRMVKKPDGILGVHLLPSHLPGNSTYNTPWYMAPVLAAEETIAQIQFTFHSLRTVAVSFMERFALPSDIGGPVAIASTVHDVREKDGIIALILLTIVLSVNLAVFNILPIPALDGGRVLFMVYELIARRKPNAKVEVAIHYAGYILLLLLIVAVTFQDILRLFFK